MCVENLFSTATNLKGMYRFFIYAFISQVSEPLHGWFCPDWIFTILALLKPHQDEFSLLYKKPHKRWWGKRRRKVFIDSEKERIIRAKNRLILYAGQWMYRFISCASNIFFQFNFPRASESDRERKREICMCVCMYKVLQCIRIHVITKNFSPYQVYNSSG